MKFQSLSRNSHFHLILALIFGGVIGLLVYGFLFSLQLINQQQIELNSQTPYHLLLAPLVLLFIWLLRRNCLYFPTKVSDIADDQVGSFWSRAMTPAHFISTLMGHASGMSLGREGAVVLFSAGLARTFNVSWQFWGSILSGIGFSATIGNYWVAPFFIGELFPLSSWTQRVYGLLGSMVAVLTIEQLGMKHLFFDIRLEGALALGFFSKLFFFAIFGISFGYLMRIYKLLHRNLTHYFERKPIYLKMMLSLIPVAILWLPEFRSLQSLGLSEFSSFQAISLTWEWALVKLALTLLGISLGFLGGEFIPLVFVGTILGHDFFRAAGQPAELGAAFGAFMLFGAGTRLKWTTYILMFSLLGWNWWFWSYFTLSLAMGFGGPTSLYRRTVVN